MSIFEHENKKFKLVDITIAEKYLTINKRTVLRASNGRTLITGLYIYTAAPTILSFKEWHNLIDRFWLYKEISNNTDKFFYLKEAFLLKLPNRKNNKTVVLFDETAFSKIEKMKEYCKVRKIKHIVTTDHLAWHFSNEKTALAFYLAFAC